jgi:hypothetical protein
MVGLMLLLAVLSGVAVGVLLDSVLLALAVSTGFLFLAGFASYKRLTSGPPPPPPPPSGGA